MDVILGDDEYVVLLYLELEEIDDLEWSGWNIFIDILFDLLVYEYLIVFENIKVLLFEGNVDCVLVLIL